jgi:hypothetical protein
MKSIIPVLLFILISPFIFAQNNFSIELKGVKTLLDLSNDLSYWNDGVGGEISAKYSLTAHIATNLSFGYSEFQYSGKGLERLMIPEERAINTGEKTKMITLTLGASLKRGEAFISPIFAIAFGGYSLNIGSVWMDVYDMQNVFIYQSRDEDTGKTISGLMFNISVGFSLKLIEGLGLNIMAGYLDLFNQNNNLFPISAGVEYRVPSF